MNRRYALILGPSLMALMVLLEVTNAQPQINMPAALNTKSLRLRFAGADARAVGEGLQALPGKVNYFIGKDESQWRTAIPTYGRVGFRAIYPGIDLAYYSDQQQLKFDLTVAPGANPDVISLAFDGANEVTIDAKTSDLVVSIAGSRIQ
jgi:hypothetical protein